MIANRVTHALGAIAIAVALSTSAEAGRFWFSLEGVPENQPITGTPSEYIDPNTGINPILDPNLGSVNLYLWGTLLPAGQLYNSVSCDVNIYPLQGDVQLVDSLIYNYSDTQHGLDRWDYVDQGTRTPYKLDDTWAVSVGSAWGFSGSPLDGQYDPDTWSMLLGVVTLEMTPDARAEVFWGVGYPGFGSQPPGQPVYFGWGDEPLQEWDIGMESRLPDAVVIPEPATLIAILVAGIAIPRHPS